MTGVDILWGLESIQFPTSWQVGLTRKKSLCMHYVRKLSICYTISLNHHSACTFTQEKIGIQLHQEYIYLTVFNLNNWEKYSYLKFQCLHDSRVDLSHHSMSCLFFSGEKYFWLCVQLSIGKEDRRSKIFSLSLKRNP